MLGNLAEIQPKIHKNVQKRTFCKMFQESMGLGSVENSPSTTDS